MKQRFKTIKYAFLYHLIKFILTLSAIVPRKAMIRGLGLIGVCLYYIMPQTRALCIKHLTMAYPELTQKEIIAMSRGVFKNMGRNVVDVLRYHRLRNVEQLYEIMEINGLEHIDNALNKQQGVVLVGCHRGAFDLSALYFQMAGYKICAVGARLKNPKLNELITQNRISQGGEFFERGEGTIKMIKYLKSSGIVFILPDQDTTKVQNVFVDFFGHKAATPIGPAILAYKTKAAIIPIGIHMNKHGKHVVDIQPEITYENTGNEQEDLLIITQKISDEIERFVREAPEQWVWFHERWKTQETTTI